jgi:hypothetical protein
MMPRNGVYCGDGAWAGPGPRPLRARPPAISAPLNAQKFSELLMIVGPKFSF